jgi:hypothetical protein
VASGEERFLAELGELENRWTWVVACAGGVGVLVEMGLRHGGSEGESRETTADNKICSNAE